MIAQRKHRSTSFFIIFTFYTKIFNRNNRYIANRVAQRISSSLHYSTAPFTFHLILFLLAQGLVYSKTSAFSGPPWPNEYCLRLRIRYFKHPGFKSRAHLLKDTEAYIPGLCVSLAVGNNTVW